MQIPRFSGVFVRQNYTSEVIRQEQQAWLRNESLSAQDVAYFDSARREFMGEDVSSLRAERKAAEPQAAREYQEVTARIAREIEGNPDLKGQAKVQAHADAINTRFPFKRPTAAHYFANSAAPQVTYLLFPGNKAVVLTGKDASAWDWAMGLNPHSINGDSEVAPLWPVKQGLRVNYDFRNFAPHYTDFLLNSKLPEIVGELPAN